MQDREYEINLENYWIISWKLITKYIWKFEVSRMWEGLRANFTEILLKKNGTQPKTQNAHHTLLIC